MLTSPPLGGHPHYQRKPMTDDIAAKFDRYIELQAQKNAIEAELKKLSTSLLLLFDPEAPSVPWKDKVFRRMERVTYSYSPAVQDLEKQVKAAKKEEEKSGIAEPSVTVYIRVTSAKPTDTD